MSHDKYPEFEGFSDTQSAVLTGSGGSADWLDEASFAPGIDSTGDRFSSGLDSMGTGSAPEQKDEGGETGSGETGSGDESSPDTQGEDSSDDATTSSDESQDSSDESSSDESSGVGTWTSTDPVKP